MNPAAALRLGGLATVALAVAALGGTLLLAALQPVPATGRAAPAAAHVGESWPADAEIRRRFDEAALMLHAHRPTEAVVALHRVLELAPRMPEAHVNMGFALLELDRVESARDFFAAAIELRPRQANAYFGLAEALDRLGDRPGAIGAMRTYLHLEARGDRFIARARAALWEWQSAGDAQP